MHRKKGKQYVSLPECQAHCRTPNTQWCNEYLPHGTLANSNYLGKSDHSSFELPPLGGMGNWKSNRKTLAWEVGATSLGLFMWCSCFKSPEVWKLSSRWLALLLSHYLSEAFAYLSGSRFISYHKALPSVAPAGQLDRCAFVFSVV